MKLAPENINYRERERVRVSLVKVGAKDYFSFNYHETFPQRECRFSERSKLENECVCVSVRARERERESRSVSMYMCVCLREREREREREMARKAKR